MPIGIQLFKGFHVQLRPLFDDGLVFRNHDLVAKNDVRTRDNGDPESKECDEVQEYQPI
jgi:hypothetical protein